MSVSASINQKIAAVHDLAQQHQALKEKSVYSSLHCIIIKIVLEGSVIFMDATKCTFGEFGFLMVYMLESLPLALL